MTRGPLAAVGSYLLWGLLPVYWKALGEVPAGQILAHRVLWSAVVLAIALTARGDLGGLAARLRDGRSTGALLAGALLIGGNWLLYVWANNNAHMVEASLGYFVTPLVSVALGLVVLRERLRAGQWIAVSLAAIGLGYLLVTDEGQLWISLALALSFGTYGLLRKKGLLGPVRGLSLEMAMLLLPSLGYLAYCQGSGSGAFTAGDWPTMLLLVGAGPVTVVPLVLFAYGARRVSLVTMGVLQFLAPTLQLGLGVAVYDEPFSSARRVGFLLAWSALLVYLAEGALRHRSSQAQ